MNSKVVLAISKSASLKSAEKSAEFLLSFYKLEEKRLDDASLAVVRAEIARLLTVLEQEQSLRNDFCLLEKEVEDDYFVEVVSEMDDFKVGPLELWRAQKRAADEAIERSRELADFVLVKEDVDDEWAMLEVQPQKSKRISRSKLDLFAFCRSHFRRRSNARLAAFRRSWAEYQSSQLRKSSGSLLNMLAVSQRKVLCSDCCCVIASGEFECAFCGATACAKCIRQNVRAPDNWATLRHACQSCWSNIRRIVVARLRNTEAQESVVCRLYEKDLAPLMREIVSCRKNNASEDVVLSLMSRLAKKCAELKVLKENSQDVLIDPVLLCVTQFYAHHRTMKE